MYEILKADVCYDVLLDDKVVFRGPWSVCRDYVLQNAQDTDMCIWGKKLASVGEERQQAKEWAEITGDLTDIHGVTIGKLVVVEMINGNPVVTKKPAGIAVNIKNVDSIDKRGEPVKVTRIHPVEQVI